MCGFVLLGAMVGQIIAILWVVLRVLVLERLLGVLFFLLGLCRLAHFGSGVIRRVLVVGMQCSVFGVFRWFSLRRIRVVCWL